MNYLWLKNILYVCTMFNYKLISLGFLRTRIYFYVCVFIIIRILRFSCIFSKGN